MTRPSTDRRNFLKLSAAAAGGSLILPSVSPAAVKSFASNGKLDIGVIGCGGKGWVDTNGVASENIKALCDVDEKRAGPTFKKFPYATRYQDFRVMLEKEKLDAVVVSTPDHTHAPAAVMAMDLGLHIYCQKPLTHTIEEARVLMELARRKKLSTSMGNQGTGMDGFREGVEVVRSGAIGKVREIHVWTNRPIWKQGFDRNQNVDPIPKTLRWDLWLGPAPHRSFTKGIAPFDWRGFWDFGTGALGDMACHILNLPYMALKLGTPTSVEGECSGINDESAPSWSTIHYEFAARGDLPPVKFTWYDGKKDGQPNRPSRSLIPGFEGEIGRGGSIMIGDKGVMHSKDDYGSVYKLYPEDRFVEFKPPQPWLQRAPGKKQTKIYEEWIADCKGGPNCLAGFDYASPLTETVLLGNVALRTGEKIEWDSANLRATNCAAAEAFIKKDYSYGFGIDV